MPIINGRGRVGIRKPSAAAATPSIVLDGLKLYLDAGNATSYAGTGTVWTDLSGNGNNGTLVNGPTYNSGNGGSIVFDGVDDVVSTTYTTPIGLNEFTYECWIKYTAVQSAPVISKRVGGPTYEQFSLFIAGDSSGGTSGSKICFADVKTTSLLRSFATTRSFNDGNWHHAVATRTSTSTLLYVDGNLQQTSTSAAIDLSAASKLFIGRVGNNQAIEGTAFNGSISNVKLYSKALSAAEVLQNYNATLGRFYPVVSDSDAQAFVVAAGLTSSVQANAINTLVTSMKTAGIWTKMKAIYPFVGGSAASHKWNLKDPRDLNTAYRLVFTAGIVHSSNGILPNGTSDYANTYFNPLSAGISKTNFGLTVYSRTNNVRDGVDIGAVNSSNSSYVQLRIRYNSTTDFVGIYDNSFFYGNYVTNSSGLFTSVRESSTVQTFYQNGVQKAQRTGFSTTGDINLNIYLSARNLDGSATTFSNRQLAFGAIHDSLTSVEAASLYTAVQAFQTSLGRQV